MKPVSYKTDDRDYKHEATINISIGGNGDYYQQIEWKDHNGNRQSSPAVRICTSGGASSKNPSFLTSVADQYKALSGKETSVDTARSDKDKAFDMLQKILDGDVSRQEVEDFITFNRF